MKDVTSRKAEEDKFNVDDLIDEGEEVSVEIEKAKDGKKDTDDKRSGHWTGIRIWTDDGGLQFFG